MSADSPPTDRLHALDAVRGIALLLGVVLHATMAFIPGPQVWIIMDDSRSPVMALTFFAIHIFRMTTFFVIAGFFGRMMFHRRGAGGFLKDRLKRITLPFAVGYPILMAAIIAVTIWGATVLYGGRMEDLPPPPAAAPGLILPFPLGHLWFLWLLMIFYAAALILHPLLKGLAGAADPVIRGIVSTHVGVLALIAPVAAALYFHPNWIAFAGIPTPDGALVPHLSSTIIYGLAFTFGWLLQRQTNLLKVWERAWPIYLGLAVALGVGLLAAGATEFDPTPMGPNKALQAGLYAAAIWTSTIGFIGMALKFMSNESPVRRYIADASYWIYLIHLPLVMAFQVMVAKLPAPWWVKFPGILAVAGLILFASYHVMVRDTVIGGVLNGKRLPTRSPPKAAIPAAETA